MNNNFNPNSARGCYGRAHLVVPNYLTPWQTQALIYSLRPVPAWMQSSIPQSLGDYGPLAGVTRASMSSAPPQGMRSVQVPFELVGPASKHCLFRLRGQPDMPAACGVEAAKTAAPGQQVQVHSQWVRGQPETHMGKCCLLGLCDRSAHRARAKPGRDMTVCTQRGRMRKRERAPRARKKRKVKAEAGRRMSAKRKLRAQDNWRWGCVAASVGKKKQGKVAMAQMTTSKSCLHERMAQSVRVFHRLGDTATELSPCWFHNRTTSATIKGVMARSGTGIPPLKHKRGKGKRGGGLGLSGWEGEGIVHGGTPHYSVPRCGSRNAPASFTPQTRAPEIPCACVPAPCSQPEVHLSQGPKLPHGPPRGICGRWVHGPHHGSTSLAPPKSLGLPEESTPILPWQRGRMEAMKKEAQKQREQAARVTKMGLDYTRDKEKYTLESSLPHLGLDSPINRPLLFRSFSDKT